MMGMGTTGIQQQDLSTKLVNIHIVNLNDAIQSLTKRVNILETFILKQFGGNVLNFVHGSTVAGQPTTVSVPFGLNNQPGSRAGRIPSSTTTTDPYQCTSEPVLDSISPAPIYNDQTSSTEASVRATATANTAGLKQKRPPYIQVVKETELKSKQLQIQAKEFSKYSHVEIASPLGFKSLETEEALPMNDKDNSKLSDAIRQGPDETTGREILVCPQCHLSCVDTIYLQNHLTTAHSNIGFPLVKEEEDRINRVQESAKSLTHEHEIDGIQWELVVSIRGGLILCINNFMFQRSRTERGKTYYYCLAPDCKSSAQTRNDELILSTLKKSHAHPNHKFEILNLKILQTIRKRAHDEPHVGIPNIYKEERKRAEDTFGTHVAEQVMPKYNSIRTTLYRDKGPTRRPKKTYYPPGCNVKSKRLRIFPPPLP